MNSSIIYRLRSLPLIVLALAATTVPAFSQDVGNDSRMEKRLNDLGLNDAQKEQLRLLRDSHRQSTEGLRTQIRSAQQTIASTSRDDPNYATITAQARQDVQSAREQMRAQQQLFQTSVRGLLTPDQLNTLETRRAERRERMSERPDGRMEQRPRRMERRQRG